MNDYQLPVSQLLTVGKVQGYGKWQDYRALGFTATDVPALLQMATDDDLNYADSDSLEVWAPLHARRALAQLRAEDAIEPLIDLIRRYEDDDWLQDDATELLLAFGPRILPALSNYLATFDSDSEDDSHSGMISAVEAVGRIGKKYPEVRKLCVALLLQRLQLAEEQDASINGVIIDMLLELNVKDALSTIAQAFLTAEVDEMFVSWKSVREHFGLPAGSQPQDFLT